MKLDGTFKKFIPISAFFLIGFTQQVHADPIGTIIGGIAGSQFGQGNGKLAMTIIGAVAGDLATSQVRNVQVVPSYQPTYYAQPIYNPAPIYVESHRPRAYYQPPIVPQVYYQPALAYQYPYPGYRLEGERRFYGNRYHTENYREYREHYDHHGWR